MFTSSASAKKLDRDHPSGAVGIPILENLVDLTERGAWTQPADLIKMRVKPALQGGEDVNGLWKLLVIQGRHHDTPFVKAAFLAFGLFDVWRVEDPTTLAVLDEMHAELHGILAGDERSKYAAAQARMSDALFMSEIQDFVAALGPPKYHPAYMIRPGVDFFTEQQKHGHGLRDDVSPGASWETVLDHLFCTKVEKAIGQRASSIKTIKA